MSICRGCGAAIEWIETVGGRPMPVDPGPHLVRLGDGPDSLVTAEGKTVKGTDLGPWSHGFGSEGHVVGYISHFATCGKAKEFRKGGKGR